MIPTFERGDVIDEAPADANYAYFVTARDRNGRYAALLGPFGTHREALALVDRGRHLAHEQYPRDLDFGDVAFGTAKMGRGAPVMLIDTTGLPPWVTADVLRAARVHETSKYGDTAYHDAAEVIAKAVRAELEKRVRESRSYDAAADKARSRDVGRQAIFDLFDDLRPFRGVVGITGLIDDLDARSATYSSVVAEAVKKKLRASKGASALVKNAQAAAMQLGDARTRELVGSGGLSGASTTALRKLIAEAKAAVGEPTWTREERKRITQAGNDAIKAHRTGEYFSKMGGLHTMGMGGLKAIRERGQEAMKEQIRRERTDPFGFRG